MHITSGAKVEVEVAMKAMTCHYGRDGLVRAVPTPRE
jgi:hypothetical protein